MKNRKRKGKDTWHFCTNCSNWPTSDYDERDGKPTYGEFCNECLALQLRVLSISESMGDHDSEVMDDGCIDRGDA
jgi:hypothetical protein